MKLYTCPKKDEWKQICTRPAFENSKLETLCEEVFTRVKAKGDTAIIDYTTRYDQVLLDELELSDEELKKGVAKASPQLKAAIDVAYRNIQTFHKSQTSNITRETIETMPGVLCWRESRAIEKVGLYVPGGTAPLISSALMLGVPAQIAGCKELIVCSPPDKNGNINDGICYAAQKIGATKVIKVGGAQAIAALSIGTESVPKVDKIFGPGNQYVTAAKQLAVRYGVAIDIPAGPSELLVIADNTANPAYVAADLLSQAEHGSDSQVVLVTTDINIVNRVKRQIAKQLEQLSRKDIALKCLEKSLCILLGSFDEAIEFSNMYAPEHLILSVKNPTYVARLVENAGSVFLGNYSPESGGDYASGTNHALPTNGWAASYGGVSLDSFVKKVTFQSLTKDGLAQLAPTIETLALAEGLDAHARAVSIRLLRNNNV